MKKDQCRFSLKLNAYIDAELTKHEFEKIQEHLKHCHLCQQKLRDLNKTKAFLDSYKEEEVPELIIKNILHEAEKMKLPANKSWLQRKVVSFSIAASVIISFLTGVLLSNLAFNQDTSSDMDFGQNSLYSYFEGEY